MHQLTTTNQPLYKPKLTRLKPNLEEIIIYIYRFRFLNSKQYQKLLNHKSHTYILEWLRYLVNQNYIKRYYKEEFAGKPSYYSLGTIGRKYLIKFKKEIGDVNIYLLDRVWDESKYGEDFQRHTMFLGYVFLSLDDLVKRVDDGRGKLKFFTQVDLKGVEHLVTKEPDAFFFIEDKNKNVQRYFLEMIQEHARWKEITYKIGKYFTYYKRKTWQNSMKTPFPEIIIVCSNYHQKNGIRNQILFEFQRRRLELPFYLITKIEIMKQGINASTLQKVVPD